MSEVDTMVNTLDAINENQALKPLMDLVEQIMSMPQGSLTDENVNLILKMVQNSLTPNIKNQTIEAIINEFEQQAYTRTQAASVVQLFKEQLNNLIDELKPSEKKREVLQGVFNSMYNIYDEAMYRYHIYNIELPIQLDEGAQIPTYAHATDAAADLYAAEDTRIPAHSISNMVRTGVHVALPENWMALILPRSSIGMKTGLRLSNSAGVIDSKVNFCA